MTSRAFDLLIVGELNVDIIVSGDVTPEFGRVEKIIDDLTLCAGSSSAIVAVSAARMGLRVLFSSRVGDDAFGHFAISRLREAGLDTRHVTVDPSIKTGAGVALSRGQDRAMLTYLGSIAAVSPRDVQPAWLGQARHLHVASPFLLSGLKRHLPQIMRQAKAEGLTVSLDTNWDPSGRWDLDGFFDHVDVFLPNENELRAISGENDLDVALAHMAERVPLTVLKQGSKGATAAWEGQRLSVPAYCVAVADTTGAGDSFDGGFLAGWLRGEPLEQCLRLGAACGGLTTTRVGGLNGQPSWDEAVKFIRSQVSHGACQ
ncbi:MAG: carbohydrate kinase family protein [Anaerolineae bacterium]